MQYKLVSDNDSNRLVLFFAGWAMDAKPFEKLHRDGYDTMVVWDYRQLDIDWRCVSKYDEICVLAWSMGVYAASRTLYSI
jgi:biotin synthesis protein BioG